jgi:hypothetical protein
MWSGRGHEPRAISSERNSVDARQTGVVHRIAGGPDHPSTCDGTLISLSSLAFYAGIADQLSPFFVFAPDELRKGFG